MARKDNNTKPQQGKKDAPQTKQAPTESAPVVPKSATNTKPAQTKPDIKKADTKKGDTKKVETRPVAKVESKKVVADVKPTKDTTTTTNNKKQQHMQREEKDSKPTKRTKTRPNDSDDELVSLPKPSVAEHNHHDDDDDDDDEDTQLDSEVPGSIILSQYLDARGLNLKMKNGQLPTLQQQVQHLTKLGQEGKCSIEELTELMCSLEGEGEMAPGEGEGFLYGEGEFDFDGEGEFGAFGFGEEGEMEWPMGWGEEGEEGDYGYDDEDHEMIDDDDDSLASMRVITDEKDDLEEMLSLEAPASSSTKKDKKQTKKVAATNDDDDEDDEDDDDVVASFEFHDPEGECDYHAIKRFISPLIDKKDFDAGAVADIIAAQCHVGTTIKCTDAGAEPLGFISLLDWKQHENIKAFKQIKNYVLSNSGSDKHKKELEEIFRKPLGLLLTDRIMNLPMEVVPALYNELLKDIQHARTLKGAGDWKFDNILIITTVCQMSLGTDASSGNSNTPSNKKDKKDKKGSKKNEDVWYTRFEDEFFAQNATISRLVPSSVMIPWLDVGKVPGQHLVMICPFDAISNVRDILAERIGIDGEESTF